MNAAPTPKPQDIVLERGGTDARVLLTVSKVPPKMPDFVGHGINAARATLSSLNVTFTITDVIDAGVSEGTVLSQVPAAGAPSVAPRLSTMR